MSAVAPPAPGTAATLPPSRALAAPSEADRGTVRHDQVRSRRWTVRGLSKVVGEVAVDSADIRGAAVVGGPLTARALTLAGSLDARGPVAVAGTIRFRGTLEAAASVRVGTADVRGTARIRGEVTVEGRWRNDGALDARGLRAGALEVHGTANVPGTIVAGEVIATLTGDSSFGEIFAPRVRLQGPAPNVVRDVLGRSAVVHVERIEADTVTIEAARVRFVRAREITLGRDAHVGTAEGTIVRASASSHVGPESWSRPPDGLRR